MESSATTDYADRPAVVIWEPTRACDLACLHCRATAQPTRSNFELSTYEGYKLIGERAGARWAAVDAGQAPDEVFKAIMRVVEQRLPKG